MFKKQRYMKFLSVAAVALAMVTAGVSMTASAFSETQSPTGAVVAQAQTPAPDTLAIFSLMDRLPSIDALHTSKAQRLDMLDYYHAGNQRDTRNMVSDGFFLTSFAPDKVTFRSADSVMESSIALIPTGKDTLIVSTTNVSLTPELEKRLRTGSVKVFDNRGRLVTEASTPDLSHWLVNPKISVDSLEILSREVPFVLARADFDPASKRLIFTNLMKFYYPSKDVPEELKAFRNQLVFELKGKKFKAVKQ